MILPPHSTYYKSEFKPPSCSRFNTFYQVHSNKNRAVIFLKLLKMGCPKSEAIKFCSKPFCKIDGMVEKEGPQNYKKLKIKHQVCHNSLNGWQYDYPTYNLGKEYYQGTEEFLENDNQEKLLEKHFIRNETQIREDFKKKIRNLATYYTDLNNEYGFPKDITENQFKEKLRSLREKIKARGKMKHFIKLNDNAEGKLYHLGEELFEESKKNYQNNIIKELNIFPTAGNPMENRRISIQKKKSNEGAQFYSDYELDPLITSIRTPHEIVISQDPREIERIKKKSTIFYNLEAQTQYLEDIANVETIAENSNYFSGDKKKSFLNSKKNKRLDQNENTDVKKRRTIISSLDQDSKRYIEEEFNFSKYLAVSHAKASLAELERKNNKLKKRNDEENTNSDRTSYLTENLSIRDLNDPESFQEGLRNMGRSHVNFLSARGKKESIDQTSIESIKKKRNEFINQYRFKTTKTTKR